MPGPPSADRPAERTRRVALLALTLGVFLVTLNVTVVVVSLPAIERGLHARPDQTAWIIDAYNLVGASLLLLAGFLADRLGRKRVLCTGYALFTLGAILCAVAPTAGWLLAFRALQALGGTALTPTSLAIVAGLYPIARERAQAIGIWGVASGIGTGLGPIVGGGITDWLGWRAVFAANGIVGAVALAIVLRVVPQSRSAVRRRFDARGQALAATLLSTLTYALIEAPRYGWTSPRIVGLLVLDVVLAATFAFVELRVSEPLIDLHLFRDRQFTGAVVLTVAAFFAFGGFIYENALYLQSARGYSALAAGVLTLPAALPTLIGGPLAGRAVATRGPRGVLTGGMALMGVGIATLALLPAAVGVGWLLLAYTVLGVGYAVINAPISTVAVASMPPEQSGVAAAVASSARNVGLVLGIAVLGSLVTGHIGSTSRHGPAFLGAFHDGLAVAYGVGAAVALAAAVVAVLTLRSAPPVHTPSAVAELER